jgi:hypothetical protein
VAKSAERRVKRKFFKKLERTEGAKNGIGGRAPWCLILNFFETDILKFQKNWQKM